MSEKEAFVLALIFYAENSRIFILLYLFPPHSGLSTVCLFIFAYCEYLKCEFFPTVIIYPLTNISSPSSNLPRPLVIAIVPSGSAQLTF